MSYSKKNLIWIDLEMTGLDTQADSIIEIATIITDSQLDIVAEGPALAIKTDEHILANMDQWNTKQHNKSGLIERVKASTYSLAEAERLTLAFITPYVPSATSPMCGNSICQDRRFLARQMPQLESYFFYRNLDVSTIKELAHRWAPQQPSFEKVSQHLALQDIHDSIAELRYYRKHYFVC